MSKSTEELLEEQNELLRKQNKLIEEKNKMLKEQVGATNAVAMGQYWEEVRARARRNTPWGCLPPT